MIETAYDLPHKVEGLHYMYAIKEWLAPHLRKIEQHSRPHAFKFYMKEDGQAGMLYRHWSSEGSWRGDEDGGPLVILASLPTGSPSLYRATSAHQNSVDVIQSGVKHCADRFTMKEREWWENFLRIEEKKRALWQNMTEHELRCGGGVGWYLKSLKECAEPAKKVDVVETEDVQRKKRTIEKLYAKENAFKQVLGFSTASGPGKTNTFQTFMK